jgi:Zn-dependent membrane protease YugP
MVAVANRESQTVLAKLLAKENIQVAIGNYKTAFFDVKNRVLGLPTWNTDNKSVSDLLIGHEVGHALYTPSDAVTRFKESFLLSHLILATLLKTFALNDL